MKLFKTMPLYPLHSIDKQSVQNNIEGIAHFG